MRKGILVAVALACGLSFLGLALDNTAQARPKYMGQFLKDYPKIADAAKKKKCNVCHDGNDKKKRNDYGKELAKHVMKNEKDAEKISKGLKEAAKAKPEGSEKTYGEKIEAGMLPND